MRINTKKLLGDARKDYERTWAESARLLKVKGKYFSLAKKRKPHPLFDLIIKARDLFLEMGFTEVITPLITEECHVYLQYGPEAPVILDRIFYLAGLPRADIGISKDKISEIKKVVPQFSEIKELQQIFRRYKKGEIESDDLTETLVEELGIREEQATQITSLFPEFSQLKPVPTKLTLRSHTTSSWFPILREMQYKETLPLQLFSISPKFRREQKLDVKHLYESWTASIVIMAEEISLEDGQKIVEQFFGRLGFDKVEFAIKRATSKYYAPRTEFEVFVRHPKNGESIEIGDGGLYNPLSLARYKIPYPVFNFGAGLERIAMIRTGIADIRKLVYPHLYVKVEYTDEQLAGMVEIDQTPSTREGEKLVKAIVQTAVENANQSSPCQFLAYKGNFLNRSIVVHVYESDVGKKLIGPAALNIVYVYDGNVLGVPRKGLKNAKIVRERGFSTGICYLDAVAALASASIEKRINAGEVGKVNIRVKIAKLPSDVNVRVQAPGMASITSKNKKIIVKGPVFVGIRAKIA
ncbi:MAG: O-phosphoserine--tRNA ligase [Candidatus Bathyarchaeota archaeon]|nr:MAG: O-phosphoserine--tRNA ligase [Candidatus Bathyarchaeota archaeon]